MSLSDELMKISNSIVESVNNWFPHGGGGKKISLGADGDATREIDKIAEDAALSKMEELALDWNILSEEVGSIRTGSRYTLVLDPIDGTNNAISQIPFYSTSLALLDEAEEQIIDAIVVNIPSNDVFTSKIGEGAFKNNIPIRTRRFNINEATVSSYIGPEAQGWTEPIIFWPKRTRYFGSISLEVSLVASGSLDLFVMFGRIPRFTDIAAASLILREAGGEAFLMDNDNIIRVFNDQLDHGPTKAFFAVGDPSSLRTILKISNIDHEFGAGII